LTSPFSARAAEETFFVQDKMVAAGFSLRLLAQYKRSRIDYKRKESYK